MRARVAANLAIVAALLLPPAAGCREESAPDPDAGPRVDPASRPGRMTLELWQLRPGIRLQTWAAANLGDQVMGPDSVPDLSLLGWCARGVSLAEVQGQPLLREAYFYPPEPPDDLALPDSGAGDLVGDCTLGLLRLTGSVPDTSAKGSAEADSLAGAVGNAFGARSTESVGFARSAFWSRVARFRRGDVVVFTAYEAAPLRSGDSTGHRLVAVAFLPTAGLSRDGSATGNARYSPADTVPLDSAFRMAALDSSLAAPLRRIAARSAQDTAKADQAELVGHLVRWVGTARSLPAARRAAALYAADMVLERSLCSYGLCERGAEPALAGLRAAGAAFTWSPLGGSWVSNHAWLSQARALDRDSPLGQRILLAQMAHAFDFSGTCARETEGFRAVIDNGERYLERLSDSPIAAEVHFMLGEAYRDIVALASGAGGDYADASLYQEEAVEARALALAHYEAALAAGAGSPTAQAAWRRAWWLLAGLAPRETRFYCVYD